MLATHSSAGNPPWTLDGPIEGLGETGLPMTSVLRSRIFTFDARPTRGGLGRLAFGDTRRVEAALNARSAP